MQWVNRLVHLLFAVLVAASLPIATFIVSGTLLRLYWDDEREARDGACIGCGFLIMILTGVAVVVGVRLAPRIYRRWRRA